jgi:hypothetical protein
MKFQDKDGVEWLIELDIGVVSRLASADSRFGLLAPTALLDAKDEKSQLQMRLADIRHAGMLFELLWLICEPQAKERGINAEQFAKRITPSLLKARRALFDEWQAFCQGIGLTGEAWMLGELIAEMEQVETEVAARMNDPRMAEVKTKARSKITEQMSKSFGNLQDSLASILED